MAMLKSCILNYTIACCFVFFCSSETVPIEESLGAAAVSAASRYNYLNNPVEIDVVFSSLLSLFSRRYFASGGRLFLPLPF